MATCGSGDTDTAEGIGRLIKMMKPQFQFLSNTRAISAYIGITISPDGTVIGVRGLITNRHMMDAYMRTASECQCPFQAGLGFHAFLQISGGDCLLFRFPRFPPRRESCP